MRGLFLFLGGVAVGLGVQLAIAQSQNQNADIVRLNHVGVSVPDMDAAISYYTETLGFPEAFRVETDSGAIALVYVQVSENTFIEIQPANANRPEGISHFGLHVENMVSVTDRFKASGADVQDIVTVVQAPFCLTSLIRTAFEWSWLSCLQSPCTGRRWIAGNTRGYRKILELL